MGNNANKFSPGEKWATIRGIRTAYGEKYAISNQGRLVKFTKDIKQGSLLKGGTQQEYPIWRFKMNGEFRHFLLHRLVAQYFLSKPAKDQTILLHINHIKIDNRSKNLKWATQLQATAHQQKDPAILKARAKRRAEGANSFNAKLTEAKVRTIKKLLAKGKSLKDISTRYAVSDMQIHRIKTGKNWGHVK